MDAYQNQVTADSGHNVALIDFDGDETPELVYTRNSEYKLYTYKDDAVSEIEISPENSSASMYGKKFYTGYFGDNNTEYEYFLFEYVPGEKLIRTHSSNSCKNDYSCNSVSYEEHRSSIGDSNAKVDYAYKDFDNDGIDELIVYGECYTASFFDTFGDNVYLMFSSGGTADMASVVTTESGNVIIRCDIGHGGRQIYDVSTYDACGCLVDWYELSAEYYDNINYTHTYRGKTISMEEYENIYNALFGIDNTD